MDIKSATARFSVLLCTTRIVTAYEPAAVLCRIHRIYIHNRHSGRAWQPSPTRRFCIQYRSEHLPISESTDLFSAGGHGGPPLRGGVESLGQVMDSPPNLCRGGHPRHTLVSIVDWSYRFNSRHKKTTHAMHRRLVFTSSV